MKNRIVWMILCSILMIGLAGCDPKVIEPPKDPFVLGENTITSINVNMKTKVYPKDTAPLNFDFLQIGSWVKTTQTILNETTLKLVIEDDKGYEYKIYRQSGKYLAIIKNEAYTKVHRYWIDHTVMTSIIQHLADNNLSSVAGNLDFVKAYWGTDETTVFEVDPILINQYFESRDFTAPIENIDLTRRHAEFSMIDELGNTYHFYAQAHAVLITWAKDGSSELFSFEFSPAMDIYRALTDNYVEKITVNQLNEVRFTQAYLEGIETFSPSKMFPIYPNVSDMLNLEMRLDRAFKADLLPDDQSECTFIFKDESNLYYVFCFNPYVVGVGPDPKGALTYYSLGDYNDTNLGGNIYRMSVPAPAGSRIDNLTFTRVTAVMHCECDHHADLSSAQSNYLNALMDLADHATVAPDFIYFSRELQADDLFYLTTSTGKRLDFYINPATKEILFAIDYNGWDQYGSTYYRIDPAGYEKVLEAHFYLSSIMDPAKADANPTFDAFYIGDVLSGNTAIIDLPMKTLTSAQITAIDGLLQRSQWQVVPIYDSAIPLNSAFVLRKNSNEFYVFCKVGSLAVVNEVTFNGDTKVYLVPASALNDVLTKLKTY